MKLAGLRLRVIWTLPVFYYLDLRMIEIKNCAQAQEACDARLFVLQNIFTIQREDSSHAVFFHFGNVSTFRKYGFLRSSMQHRRKDERCTALIPPVRMG